MLQFDHPFYYNSPGRQGRGLCPGTGTVKKKNQDKYIKNSIHDNRVAEVMPPKLIKVTKTLKYFALFLIIPGISQV
jgi:hypothetical protein